MSLFGLVGEIVKAPSSVLKDVVGIDNKGYGSNNTADSASSILEELSDIFE